MIYIIMCGGNYHTSKPKQLRLINGEPIVARTIRLLRENNISNIAISTNNPIFKQFGVPLLSHNNKFGEPGGHWLDAFYPTDESVCYLFGDVIYSPEAIKTIINTNTDSIELFASAPPFDNRYHKNWAEPYAFKVVNQKYFRECINKCIELIDWGVFYREPISWELWQIIKHTPLNRIDYTNYIIINDYTTDCDNEKEYNEFIRKVKI